MRCWTVPIIGDGSDQNPYRPDVPQGITWQALEIEPPAATCQISTDADLSGWPNATPCDPPPAPDPDI